MSDIRYHSTVNVANVEITANGEVIFGLYPEDKMLVKADADSLTTARERLTAALECLSDYCEPSRAID